MSPIIPIKDTVAIFYPVTMEFSADRRMMSVYPSRDLTQTETGII
jgi:hypothetical protein